MAKTRPDNLEAMRYISGVGEQKLDNPYETFKDFYTKDYQRFV